jgi:hypothetical protein
VFVWALAFALAPRIRTPKAYPEIHNYYSETRPVVEAYLHETATGYINPQTPKSLLSTVLVVSDLLSLREYDTRRVGQFSLVYFSHISHNAMPT